MRIIAIITLAVMAIGLSACAHKDEPAMTSTKSSYSK
jgi:Flp pilus assembly protein TadD